MVNIVCQKKKEFVSAVFCIKRLMKERKKESDTFFSWSVWCNITTLIFLTCLFDNVQHHSSKPVYWRQAILHNYQYEDKGTQLLNTCG